jgi:hypothetical protein
MQVIVKIPFGLTVKLNLPFISVDIPLDVPSSKTEAPVKGRSDSSTTTPEILIFELLPDDC